LETVKEEPQKTSTVKLLDVFFRGSALFRKNQHVDGHLVIDKKQRRTNTYVYIQGIIEIYLKPTTFFPEKRKLKGLKWCLDGWMLYNGAF
jgi:hypothetical protein